MNSTGKNPQKSYLFTSVYNRSMNYIRDHKKFISQDIADIQIENPELSVNS
ncbi:MAG: hypothetical protein HC906_04835, partial [Bacteroidales bacterium]|nr:hypothetical protein [Bacteroidales bacterium]